MSHFTEDPYSWICTKCRAMGTEEDDIVDNKCTDPDCGGKVVIQIDEARRRDNNGRPASPWRKS